MKSIVSQLKTNVSKLLGMPKALRKRFGFSRRHPTETKLAQDRAQHSQRVHERAPE